MLTENEIIGLAQRRDDAEAALAASVLPDTGRLVDVAEAEGIQPGHFGQPDIRLIYCAAVVSRGRPLVETVRLARHALWEDGFYDDQWPAFGPHWSDAGLCAFAECFFPSEQHVRCYARRLLSLWTLDRDMRDLAARARGAA